jgi:hypothetical protein
MSRRAKRRSIRPFKLWLLRTDQPLEQMQNISNNLANQASPSLMLALATLFEAEAT